MAIDRLRKLIIATENPSSITYAARSYQGAEGEFSVDQHNHEVGPNRRLPLLQFPARCIIRGTMYRAEIEPMPENPSDRVPKTGLWKVVIYEGERFVRTDQERITYFKAEKLAKELNLQLGNERTAKGALGQNSSCR
jgi:hypothetical protein